jgi:hypothetical protein
MEQELGPSSVFTKLSHNRLRSINSNKSLKQKDNQVEAIEMNTINKQHIQYEEQNSFK